MSKIICEVCGTSYQETSEQCPICGCVRSGETEAVPDNFSESGDTNAKSYTYVKGGRFSKANVKKRKQTLPPPVANETLIEEDDNTPKTEAKSSLDKWLTAAIIVLLLSIVAIVIYIAFNFFDIELPLFSKPEETSPTTTAATTEPTTAPTTEPVVSTQPQEVACQALKIGDNIIKLDKVGAVALLNIEIVPSDCTDPITYSSANESVATVTESGKVVAVGSGTTTVTAACGLIKLECTILVNVEEEATTAPTTEPTTAPTTEPTTAPTTKPAEFELNRSDFTLLYKGESHDLYSGNIDRSLIAWTSDNEAVATVTNGKVVAVGPGTTNVHAEYNGEKLSCIVRCNFSTEETTGTEPTEETEGNVSTGSATISHTDVTIKIGESFNLVLSDSGGKTISVDWHMTSTEYCTVSGNTITGKSVGFTKVYTEYNGSEYACDVHVKSA